MSHDFEMSKRLQRYLVGIIKNAQKDANRNHVKIDTNLECNVPEKDIHKIAGPFIDEWVYETFDRERNKNSVVKDVISKESSSLEDVYISLDLEGKKYNVLIDVKTASLAKGNNAGKGSNLTSFRKIRPFYVNNPNALFFILSIEHKNLMQDEKCHGFELVDCNIFDLKYVAERELFLNTAMGDQFQIANSMNVTQVDRTTKDFLEIMDNKFVEKYSQEKLDKIIAEEKAKEEIKAVAGIVYSIIETYEPINKRKIFEHLKKILTGYENVDSMLKKSIDMLKKNSSISTLNKRDYIISDKKRND